MLHVVHKNGVFGVVFEVTVAGCMTAANTRVFYHLGKGSLFNQMAAFCLQLGSN
jgi:hypothetical protein